jgi:CheY-like chemotaxis protein
VAKQHLLIVDSDPKSLRVLEVSLKKAGFSVTRASNGLDAIEKIQISAPDMIITETAMPEMNGFELIQQLRSSKEWKDIPVMFLTAQKSIEDKIRGLEQGVEDYLTKPIFIREILARVSLVMQRRQRERLETRGSKTEFAGNLSDMGIIDLIQTIDISQKSGVIHVDRKGDSGDIFFRNGKVIDASTSSRSGEEAVYRMLVWSEGHFHIEFKNVKNTDVISLSTQGLLMEGMRRLDEWGRLQEQLPSLNSIFDIDDQLLAERLGEIPDEINTLLKHFDGRRSLMEVVNLCPLGDLEALTVITKLFFEGLIYDMGTMQPEDLETAPPTHPATSDVATGAGASIPAPDAVVGEVESAAEAERVATRAHSMETYQPSVGPDETIDVIENPRKSEVVAGRGESSVQAESKDRPITGKYNLASMADAESDAEDGTSGGQASKLSLPAAQKTMMMHVSKTPTDPPPRVATRQDDEAHMAARGQSDAERHHLDDTDTLSGGVVPSDFDELVHSTADIETTAPHTVVDDADGVVPDMDSDAAVLSEEENDDSPRDTSPVIGRDESPVSTEQEVVGTNDAAVAQSEEGRGDAGPKVDEADVDGETADDSTSGKETMSGEDDDGALVENDEEEDVEDEDGEEADEWAELDSATSRGHLKKVIIAVIAIVVLGGAAAIIFGTDLILKPSSTDDDVPAVVSPTDKTEGGADKTAGVAEKNQTNVSVNEQDGDTAAESVASAATAEATGEGTTVDTDPGRTLDSDVSSATVSATSGKLPSVSPPLAPPPDAEKMAEYKKLVKKASKQSREKQLATLASAIAIYPNGVDALTDYTLVAMEKRKYHDKALEYATRVIQIDPGNAKAWLAIGYIYQLQNKSDESKEAYRKCAECKGPAEFVRNCKLLAR